MLDQAKNSLDKLSNKFSYLVANYSNLELSGSFDVVISALSIHHLTGEEKKSLFKKIFTNLNNGGIFINADQVQGETVEIETKYREVWLRQVQENGIGKSELEAALERMKEDKMSLLSSQLQWLNQAGFEEVNCWYKNYSFVVYSGICL
jgi:tRNA (cmo5U34)-methyltransferase